MSKPNLPVPARCRYGRASFSPYLSPNSSLKARLIEMVKIILVFVNHFRMMPRLLKNECNARHA